MRSKTWMITKDQAAEMYARFWVARHGRAGVKLARETAISFRKKGDAEGHEIWNKVADTVKRNSNGMSALGLTRISCAAPTAIKTPGHCPRLVWIEDCHPQKKTPTV